ncbi:MAG: regulatory protein RecX [Armatimonadota bacterium]
MAEITAIEPQEKRKNRRSIFIDGEFAAGADEKVIFDLGLKIGQQITEDYLNEIIRAELINKAKERAFKLLDYRKRSISEVEQRLKKADYEEDIIKEVIQSLEEMGFLNDEDFTQSWIDSRISGKGMGKNRIKWELRQKGVDDVIADEALSLVDSDSEFDTAMESAERRWHKDHDPDVRSKKRRMASYLARLGFKWETVNRVLSTLLNEDESDGE